MKNSMRVNIYVGVCIAMLSLNANAYIDPGITGLLVQGLIAVIGGILVFLRKPLDLIKKLFKKNDH